MTNGYRIKFGTDLKTQCIAKVQRLNENQPESAETSISKADCVKLMHAFAVAFDRGTLVPSLAGTPQPYINATREDGTGKLMVQVAHADAVGTMATLDLDVESLTFHPTQVAVDPGNAPGSPLLN